MVHVPDELIMAYADGQVSPEEKIWLESILAVDPAVRARLEPFLATGPGQLTAFDAILAAPIPDRLIDTVRGTKPAAKSSSSSTRLGLFDRLFPNGFGLTPALGYAAALVAGIGIGSALLSAPQTEQPLLVADRDGFVASGRLQTALERIPSGEKSLVKEGDIRPLLTVRDGAGRICRQYEIVGRKKGPQGLACRESDGGWRITVLTGGETAASAYNASQNDGNVVDGVVDRAIKELPGHSELAGAEELFLIERGWGGAPSLEKAPQEN
jgi:hypothetical protein